MTGKLLEYFNKQPRLSVLSTSDKGRPWTLASTIAKSSSISFVVLIAKAFSANSYACR
jgi:hypothetical protein